MHNILVKKNSRYLSSESNYTPVQLEFLRSIAALISGIGFFIIVFTLTPFQGDFVSEGRNSSIINAFGYSILGVIYLCALLTLVDRHVLFRSFPASWLLVFVIAFWSCFNAQEPEASMRSLVLTLCSMIVVAGILLLPRSEREFVIAGSNAILCLMVINYAALIIIPHLATHTQVGLEGGHAGSWRGHISHKNFAAPVFSMLAIFGIYCWRVGVKIRGAAIFILAVIFVLNTNSKTTAGFFPLAVTIVFLSRLFGSPLLTVIVHLIFTTAIFCLTIGTVFSSTLNNFTTSILGDPTFTGRNSIWLFGLEYLPERFWSGYGYYGFWQSPLVIEAERNFEAAWDVRGIVSGHNTYLDALLMFGAPCGILVIAVLVFKPLADYMRAYRRSENRALADFFLMIVVFMTYDGMLETFLLNRSDAMWLLFALGSYGMTTLTHVNGRWKA
ncbi:O-antigen ligase family protein [Brucella thiophenivorans]|uniref:O-antigen ligase like membrane family protein n=1 Tax=Brucella thiophenivorans TaxID=571255 RepID=A0A256FBW5_9HYPH|nr:O-antigen ligase [Brucella thiophenivorans]OYR12220.1 O-antigen ligase like membrane family protein [Brucella thiophenivorans]